MPSKSDVVPNITTQNIDAVIEKEYYRLLFNSDGEKIRSNSTVIELLLCTVTSKLSKIYEKHQIQDSRV